MRIGSFDDCPRNLAEVLGRAARQGWDETGISLLDNRGRVQSFRSFEQVQAGAREGAGRWRELGVTPGERILICLPTSWDFLDAWFGAVLVGALPVALAPPGALGSPTVQVGKGLRVCEAIGATWLVAPEAFLEEARRGLATGEFPHTDSRLLDVEDWRRTTPLEGPDVEAEPEETAFLQLTSGSTGLPRAVEIRHSAVVHNALSIDQGLARLDGEGCEHLVSWLPLYHDMGLVGCLANALVNGISLDLLTPRSFLARPWIWLEAIERRSNVMSPAPNFAYQLCVERVPRTKVERLDLRPFRHILSGSEMVRPETVREFLDHFADAGAAPERFRPCYGLAEATLGVSMDSRGGSARTRSAVEGDPATVALGEPLADHEVAILPPGSGARNASFDPADALEEGAVGRVLVRSPGLMKGYFQDPLATAEVLRDGWLDTGDLGFLYDGELYLTGRSKEILILNGTNVMPHEIEWIAEEVSGAGGSQRCGAFSVLSEHGEEPVLVMETTVRDTAELEDLKSRVSSAVGRGLSIPLAETALVRRGSIPRTSSGKVQRGALRRLYLEGELERIDGDGAEGS